jgi:hypothetical protein
MKKRLVVVLGLILITLSVVGIIHFLPNTKVVDDEVSVEKVLQIHKGKFAFCGASGAVPTGRKIKVQGRVFDEGCAICPVLDGPSIANLAMYGEGGTWGEFNVKDNPQTPDGTDNTVWSFFWFFDKNDTVPQFNPQTDEWEWMNPVNRKFVVNTKYDSTSMSNMFAMPGVIFDTTENGIVLAKCYGPLNEAAVPWYSFSEMLWTT